MKIIHLIPDNSIGGLQNFCLALASAQSSENDVQVFHFKPTRHNVSISKSDLLSLFTFKKYFGLLFTKTPILLHTHGNVLTLIGTLSLLNRNINIIHTVHNEAKYEAGGRRMRVHSLWFKWRCAYPIVIAESLMKNFEDYYGYPPYGYVLNGIPYSINDPSPNQNDKATYNLLFLGRLDYQKNVNLLLNAVKKVHDKNLFPVKLHVAGSDEGVYSLELFSYLQEQEIMVYYGLVDDPSFLFSTCDCICFSSVFEGVPIAAIEAKLMNLQLVTADVGGISDIIEPWDVLVEKDCTAEDFAKGISQSYAKKDSVQATTIDFSMSRVRAAYDAFYKDVMKIKS